MRRRMILAALTGLTLPSRLLAQKRLPRVEVLLGGETPGIAAFWDELRRLGWTDGQTAIIETREARANGADAVLIVPAPWRALRSAASSRAPRNCACRPCSSIKRTSHRERCLSTGSTDPNPGGRPPITPIVCSAAPRSLNCPSFSHHASSSGLISRPPA
jgi:hypothetical protein